MHRRIFSLIHHQSNSLIENSEYWQVVYSAGMVINLSVISILSREDNNLPVTEASEQKTKKFSEWKKGCDFTIILFNIKFVCLFFFLKRVSSPIRAIIRQPLMISAQKKIHIYTQFYQLFIKCWTMVMSSIYSIFEMLKITARTNWVGKRE